jgi:predicted Ser/Thr protein kinase
MKKVSAVEWLLEQLENQVSDDGKQTMSIRISGYLKEQAKEIEKQQIIDAYRDGRSDQQSEKPSRFYNRNAEFYYNETFKNK